MFSFTTMLKHNSHHRPCPPTTPFPMFTSNRPYPVLFLILSQHLLVYMLVSSCLITRACSTSLWTTSTSCTSRSSATKRSSSSPLNFFATSITILTRFNHDNSSIKIQMNQSSGKPSIYLSTALLQGAKPFQRDVHEAS